MKKTVFFLLFFLFSTLIAEPSYTPWLTGSLLAPEETVIPYGQMDVQAYLYVTETAGYYNANWKNISNEKTLLTVSPQIFFYLGLTPWMDISIAPQVIYRHISNNNSVHFGDLPIGLDFQLLDPNYTPYFPGIKLSIAETFPTGNYKDLDQTGLFADLSGAGSYSTFFNLLFYKVFHLYKHIFLSTTFSGSYTINAPVSVTGFNAYGGGIGTDGKVFPGAITQVFASFELSLSQNWALAIDNVYIHTNKTSYSGKKGVNRKGEVATNKLPSSEQISFAPAIEYNFSANLGMIAGVWFTAWGRNSTVFTSGIAQVYYQF